jgi:hypothetical protein
MTTHKPHILKARLQAKSIAKKRRKHTMHQLLTVAAGAIATHILSSADHCPMHTSILTGRLWLDELLAGHPEWFHRSMGMNKATFRKLLRQMRLIGGLSDSK